MSVRSFRTDRLLREAVSASLSLRARANRFQLIERHQAHSCAESAASLRLSAYGTFKAVSTQ
jgi:hypothetical protein